MSALPTSPQPAEGSSFLQNLLSLDFSSLSSWLSSLQSSFDVQNVSLGGCVVALLAVWYFFRVIRTIATILIALCLVYFVLRLTGYVDVSNVLPWLQEMWGGSAPASSAS